MECFYIKIYILEIKHISTQNKLQPDAYCPFTHCHQIYPYRAHYFDYYVGIDYQLCFKIYIIPQYLKAFIIECILINK